MKGLMSRRDCGAGILVFAATCLFGTAKAAPPEVTVSIDNFTFKPDVLTIKPGTAVTFVNQTIFRIRSSRKAASSNPRCSTPTRVSR